MGHLLEALDAKEAFTKSRMVAARPLMGVTGATLGQTLQVAGGAPGCARGSGGWLRHTGRTPGETCKEEPPLSTFQTVTRVGVGGEQPTPGKASRHHPNAHVDAAILTVRAIMLGGQLNALRLSGAGAATTAHGVPKSPLACP